METKPKLLKHIGSLFVFLFECAAASRFFQFTLFEGSLRQWPLTGSKASLLTWALPLTGLFVAVSLLEPGLQRSGFDSSLVLMVIFTAYIAYMLVFVSSLRCSCGGVLKELSWTGHLVFPFFFTGLALMGMVWGRKTEGSSTKNYAAG